MKWNEMEWNMESWNHGIQKKLKWFFAHRGNDSNQTQTQCHRSLSRISRIPASSARLQSPRIRSTATMKTIKTFLNLVQSLKVRIHHRRHRHRPSRFPHLCAGARALPSQKRQKQLPRIWWLEKLPRHWRHPSLLLQLPIAKEKEERNCAAKKKKTKMTKKNTRKRSATTTRNPTKKTAMRTRPKVATTTTLKTTIPKVTTTTTTTTTATTTAIMTKTKMTMTTVRATAMTAVKLTSRVTRKTKRKWNSVARITKSNCPTSKKRFSH